MKIKIGKNWEDGIGVMNFSTGWNNKYCSRFLGDSVLLQELGRFDFASVSLLLVNFSSVVF